MKKMLITLALSFTIMFMLDKPQFQAAEKCVTSPDGAIATDLVCISDAQFKLSLIAQADSDGDSELSVAELENLTSFQWEYTGADLTTIKGIEFAKNLQVFEISGNVNLYSLMFLGGLNQLEVISVTSNNQGNISSISPLIALPNLRDLTLSNQSLTHISSLKVMDIESLNLADNQITDISPLSGKTLKSVNLNHNNIRDISPLAKVLHFEVSDQHLVADLQYVFNNQRLTKPVEIFFPVTTTDTRSIIAYAGDTAGKSFINNEAFSFNLDNGTYSGNVDIEFYIVDNIQAENEFSIVEPDYLTDDEIINYFNVQVDSQDIINVDTSEVDFTMPGTYPVILFTDLGDELCVYLTIVPAPQIENPGETQVGDDDEDDDNVNPDSVKTTNPDDPTTPQTPNLPITPVTPVKLTTTGSKIVIGIIGLVLVLGIVAYAKYKLNSKEN